MQATSCKGNFRILMADDDDDDRLLARDAFEEAELTGSIEFVEDGEELTSFLSGCNNRAESNLDNSLPSLILLDLNMPRKNGREALVEIKADPVLRKLPIIVLSTSKDAEDIEFTYGHGVNSYITKPASFFGYIDLMKTIARYWFEIVQLPNFGLELA